MSTHSTISVVTPETIYQIYCNSDGIGMVEVEELLLEDES